MLILDLSHFNNYVVKTSVKYEDLKTVIQLLKKVIMFCILILKVVITTLTFLRNTESIYLFAGNLKTVQFVFFLHFNVLPFALSPAY